MKSNLIHVLLATVLLASCSQEDVIQEVDTSQSAIGFSTFVDKATRAVATNIDNFSTFKVWGTKFRNGNTNAVRIMDAIDVSNSGSTWTYTPTKYWVNSNAYSFTAIGSSDEYIANYYTYTAPPVSNISYDTYLTHYMGSLDYNNKKAYGSADLIWASQKVATLPEVGDGPSSVNLTFGHLLSRIRLKFVNSRTIENADVTLKNVKITSASTGTLDFSQYNVGTPSTEFIWTPSSDYFDCDFYFKSNYGSEYTLAKGNSELTLDQFLIPSQEAITVSFDCYTSTTMDGDANGHINITKDIKFGENGNPASFKDLDLKPGYSYTLVAYLTDELDNSGPIIFTVEKIDNYIDVTSPVYAMEFEKPTTVETSSDDNGKYNESQTISVKKITSVDELVYYGNSSTTTPASAPTRSSDSTPTEINYTDFTYKWSIPKNENYSFGGNACEKEITTVNSKSDINVVLNVKDNYSPNGKTATNTGYIPVTLSMISGGKVIHCQTVYVKVEYTKYATGGSQDGNDNDG